MIIKNGAKMSKSLGNTVSPDDMVERYGADATRAYTLFATAPDRELDWQDAGVEGVYRFLAKVYRFFVQNSAHVNEEGGCRTLPEGRVRQSYSVADLTPEARKISRKLHQTIRKITEDFNGRWHFNTSVAALMELLNLCTSSQEALNSAPRAFVADLERNIVLLLHPFAPYLSYELWEMIGETSDLLREPWPQFDPELAKEEEVEMAVQINGKLRARILVPAEADEDEIKRTAMADEKVQSAVEGKQIVKTIVIKGKLVNIVVK